MRGRVLGRLGFAPLGRWRSGGRREQIGVQFADRADEALGHLVGSGPVGVSYPQPSTDPGS
jgi:hypothetical protein